MGNLKGVSIRKHLDLDTGLRDKNGNKIYIGDVVGLTMPDGEVREFVVEYKTIKRYLKTQEGFEGEYSPVAITGVVFNWEGHDLFPSVDKDGVTDTIKMEVLT